MTKQRCKNFYNLPKAPQFQAAKPGSEPGGGLQPVLGAAVEHGLSGGRARRKLPLEEAAPSFFLFLSLSALYIPSPSIFLSRLLKNQVGFVSTHRGHPARWWHAGELRKPVPPEARCAGDSKDRTTPFPQHKTCWSMRIPTSSNKAQTNTSVRLDIWNTIWRQP